MSLRLELSMREKLDRDGRGYLFAPIPLINCIAFVYDEAPRAGVRRAKLVLKPYEGSHQEFKASWEEEDRASFPLPADRDLRAQSGEQQPRNHPDATRKGDRK